MNSMGGFTGPQGPSGRSAGQNATGYNNKKAPAGYNKFQEYTPQQMDLHNQQYGFVGPDSFLNKIASGDQSMFEQMEAPAMKQFQELMSQNASQFSGMGMGSRHGSGFQNTQSQATSDFASNLQSKRMEYMQNALKDLMGFSDQILGQSPYGMVQKPMPFWQQLMLSGAGGASEGAGKAATMALMG